MSQISENSNIISIGQVNPVIEIQALMNQLSQKNKDISLNSVLSNIHSFIPENVMAAVNATNSEPNFTSSGITVKSPNLLHAALKDGFSSNVKNLQSRNIPALVAKKASLLSVLNKMDLKVSQTETVKASIMASVKANDMKTFNTELKAVMRNLETQNAKIFLKDIASACANASYKVEFKEVKIRNENGKLNVIATNSIGQCLNTEISIDPKTFNVNASTEPIGISDGSCVKIISNFNEELKKMGIRIESQKTTPTGGVCQMPYSKIIEQIEMDQQRKKKEFERLKKMNQKSNQKQKN